MHAKKTGVTRRDFVGGAAAALAGFTIVPGHVLTARGATGPNEKLNIACIGVGGRGADNVNEVGGQNIVALCDVDEGRLGDAMKKHPAAMPFRDFRKLLDEMEKSIDAVVVATPDHTHAVAAMAAIKRGKHVYCEKPLAYSVYEIRQLMKAAREHKVVTQLGNQGHSFDSIRTFCEWVWDGAIGKVHTIHAACNAPNSAMGQLSRVNEDHPVPATLDWDLWLGPAQLRKYNPMYAPSRWRSWSPFGTGTSGDWICHVVDPVFWALDLGSPLTIQAQAKNFDPKVHGDTFPRGCIIKYVFPAKGNRGPVTLHWYTGNEQMPRPEGLEPGRTVPETGAIVLGDSGGITYGSHGAGGVRVFPETKMRAYQEKLKTSKPARTLPRVKGHHQDWLTAIRTGGKAGSDFSYGGPLTEVALLGAIGLRMLGMELKWDAGNMRFTNSDEANQFLNPPYRNGWTL